ncbi:hypothetical protein COCCADRAFT_110377 [Bipolaris zeicola 26-R-13]|uniref:Uncharacterized protein n=1 Tax=Cochliobolus carbonum (strain 26-R-13) TaxID=930089 RepID=W6XZ06_COCC2|nr:uncharacterized protein COCCADRAFT_110377 [Bipolaris zeicola 26-R-13]EUC27969.1 hypothetical protein COCCADRAFT_110377 [Bipolaris zeicola 26-R-13]
MTYNLLRKGGIPALACNASPSGDASFLQCTFQVKYDNDRLFATFSLQHNTHVYDTKDKQPFDLIYDADNLLPTTTKCQIPKRALSPEDETYVARNGFSKIHVLSLHLQKPCPIICPTASSSIVPKASCQIPSRCLVGLAKSKHIEIVFDLKWLDRKRIASFLSIVSQPERFHGFPIDEKNLRGRRLVDWTIFSPDEESVVVTEEPPPYTKATYKRPRGVSSSPSPPTKRLFIPPGSPTEKATTASLPNSPANLSSTIDESPRMTSLCAASAHSRSYAENSYPLNPKTDVNDACALENNVRSIMLNLFPAIFASFIDHSRSVSPSSSSSIDPNTHPKVAPPIKSIHQLRSLLTKRAVKHTEKKLSTIFNDMQYDANSLRLAADEEFLEIVAEEKLDIKQRKEDALEELGDEIDNVVQEKLVALSDELDRLVEQAREMVENAIDARVERYTSKTCNRAVTAGFLDREAGTGHETTRAGHAAGDRKRKFYNFRSCGR